MVPFSFPFDTGDSMLIFSALSGRVRLPAGAMLVFAGLVLSACGGGGGNDPPDGGNVPAPSLTAMAGDWVQKGCVKMGTQSFKKFLRARITGQNTLDHDEGVLSFSGGDCAGASVLVGPTKLGTVTFARSEATQSLAAHWGVFLAVTGTRSGAIWTLRSGSQLCLLGDEIPSIQPSLSAVSRSLATVPADNCFARKTP